MKGINSYEIAYLTSVYQGAMKIRKRKQVSQLSREDRMCKVCFAMISSDPGRVQYFFLNRLDPFKRQKLATM